MKAEAQPGLVSVPAQRSPGREVRTSISEGLFKAYLGGESAMANTTTGVGLFMGPVFLSNLVRKRTPDERRTTVEKFANSGAFSEAQMGRTVNTIVFLHRKAGIPLIPIWPDIPIGDEERPFDPYEKIPPVYRAGVRNVLHGVLALQGASEEAYASQVQTVASVSRYLETSEHAKASLAVFKAADRAVKTKSGTRIAYYYRRGLYGQDGPATDLQRAQLVGDLTAAIQEPVLSVGSKVHIPQDRLAKFLLNVMNPDLPQQAY